MKRGRYLTYEEREARDEVLLSPDRPDANTVAAQFGTSNKAVYQRAKRLGVPYGAGNYPEERRREIEAEFRRYPYKTNAEIASNYNLSASYVAAIRREAGLPRRPPGGKPKTRLWKKVSRINWEWLRFEAEQLGVSRGELLNSILTDARLDQEEK